MTRSSSPPPGSAEREVSALVETLHKTGRRLEELTGGELDSVIDRSGRWFLMQGVQEQLQQAETVRQAAVLDALPAHIALLDPRGVIISVNEVWRRFALEDALQCPGHGIGVNYLEVCDSARGENSAPAHDVAAGIRNVLDGSTPSFSLEYPCHAPGEPRWLLIVVTPLPGARPAGAVVMHLNITGRKLAEDAFRVLSLKTEQRERMLSAALSAMSDFAQIYDRDGRLVFVNHALLNLWGLTIDKVVGRNFHDLGYPPDLADRLHHQLRGVFETKKSVTDETPYDSPTGVQGYYEYIFSPVIAADGNVEFVVGSTREITEHKRAQAELQRQQSELRVLVDLIPAMVWFKNTENGILRVNSRVAQAAGKTVAQIEGKPSHEIYPQDAVRFYADDLEVMKSGVPRLGHVRSMLSPEGQEIWLQTDKVPYFNHDGHVIGIVIMAQDITERRQAERDLKRFRVAMDNSGDAIVLVDRTSMRYVDVNQTLCELVGYTRQEVIGMTPMELFGLQQDVLEREFDAIIADRSSRPFTIEGNYRHKDGSLIPTETRRRAMRTDQGWIIVASTRDVTERRNADNKIRRLNRVYAMLSGINALIVRVHDRDELFQQVCEIAIQKGEFQSIWIGTIDHGARRIVPIASAGADEGLFAFVAKLLSSTDGALGGSALSAQAARHKKAFVCNDLQNEPVALIGQLRPDLNIRSMATLPLVVADSAIAVIALYAREKDFFDVEEIKLLTELTDNIAFAIEHIDTKVQLDYLAYYDSLTGLANRTLFLERVAQYLRSAASGGHKLGLFYVDLERFRNINNSLGRPAGDVILKQVAEWLTSNLGDANILARIGADHFAIVLPVLRAEDDVVRMLNKRMRSFLDHPFRLQDAELRLNLRIGVARFPDDGTDAGTLLANAEAALKKAKANGERFLFYKPAMTDRAAGNLSLENQLRQALDREQFVLHYQPKIDFDSGLVCGAEALIRWNDPLTGLVPPGRFIGILEESGLIYDVGRWALRKALAEYLRWRNMGLPAVRIAVNVSPLQLRNNGFVGEIEQVIGIDPQAAAGLELELTESLLMEDVKHSIASLQLIRASGVTIAIDDFGTGFSSLSYLAKLPVDTLKIDRSFITDMSSGTEGRALVSTIIGLAHALKLKVVAEGVETDEQSRVLRLLGCDIMQGFLVSRAVPAAEFEAKFLIRPVGA